MRIFIFKQTQTKFNDFSCFEFIMQLLLGVMLCDPLDHGTPTTFDKQEDL